MVVLKTRYLYTVFVISITLLSCSSTPPAPENIVYQCDRGTALNVTLIRKGKTIMRGGKQSIPHYVLQIVAAQVTLADGTILTLPKLALKSGVTFSNGRYTLTKQNDRAYWSVGRMMSEQCFAL
jgi:membrane-bound inhibitor of C-type lysozyme